MLRMSATKKILASIFDKIGYVVESKSAIDSLRTTLNERTSYLHKLERAGVKWNESGASQEALDFILSNVQRSYSQIGQDLFVLLVTNQKRNGFFVEFGATDGKLLSNTYLLEDSYNWQGIVAEPAKIWHQALLVNRNCSIDTRCVHDSTGSTVTFRETEVPELSVIDSLKDLDQHSQDREEAKTYPVETVTLLSLLDHHGAPSTIDYLSIDTEGSEFEILQNFDFSKYQFNALTIEHNHTPQRQKIFELLTSNGYIRVLENVSNWDDWYIHHSLQKIFHTIAPKGSSR